MLASLAISPLGSSSCSSSPCVRCPTLQCRAHRCPLRPIRCLQYILALSSTLCRLSKVPSPWAKTHPPGPDLPSHLPPSTKVPFPPTKSACCCCPDIRPPPLSFSVTPASASPKISPSLGVDLVDHFPAAAATPSCVLFSARLFGPSGNFHLRFEQLPWLLQGCRGREQASQAEAPFWARG